MCLTYTKQAEDSPQGGAINTQESITPEQHEGKRIGI